MAEPKAPLPSEPVPAFIVIGVEFTDIVPVDPNHEYPSRSGMWTMLPGEQGARIGGLFRSELETDLRSDVEVQAKLPVCPSADVVGGCRTEDDHELFGQVAVDARGKVRWGVSPVDYGSCDCLAVDLLSTDDVVEEEEVEEIDPAELATSPLSEEEYREFCMEGEVVVPEPVAIVGANLYRLGMWDNMMCSEVHVLDLDGDVVPLIPGADPVQPFNNGEPPYCYMDSDEPSIDWIADYDSQCRLDGPDCESCFHDAELDMFAIRRGSLFNITGSASAAAGPCTCASPRTLSPDRCPSPVDTCGDPSAFRGLARAPYFWVETEGRYALAGDDGGLELRDANGVLNAGGRRIRYAGRPLRRRRPTRSRTSPGKLPTSSVWTSLASIPPTEPSTATPEHGAIAASPTSRTTTSTPPRPPACRPCSTNRAPRPPAAPSRTTSAESPKPATT